MAAYFNPGPRNFQQDSTSPIYVDKTGLLAILNSRLSTSEKCIALSHARRFGKSQAADMMVAYYSRGADSKALFAPFAIAKDSSFETHLNKYNVIRLDISSFMSVAPEERINTIVRCVYDEILVHFPRLDYSKPVSNVIYQVYQQCDIPFVIIIDEWDCIIRNRSDHPDEVHDYMQFLHDLFKSVEAKEYLALGYITGILPIKKIKDESALNNFDEYTMISCNELTPFYGFTEEEVQQLCGRFSRLDFESIKAWYNGYLIDGRHMYNPNSVVYALRKGKLDSYWRNTSSFEIINTYINLNLDGLNEKILRILSGEKINVNTELFQNDLSSIRNADDALTALIHLGYLGYDADSCEAYLPNYEVATAYDLALQRGNWAAVAAIIRNCDALLRATIAGNAEQVADYIEKAHETYCSILQYNNENALACVLTMAYFTAPAYYTIIRELPSGKGFADMAFLPRQEAGNRPALLVELKWDESADTAIRQIKERRYTGALQNCGKPILLVGISYSKGSEGKDKHHTCIIEEA